LCFQPPRPPTHVPESSENTPSAADSHHVDEEEKATPAPAIPVSIYLKSANHIGCHLFLHNS
jgi:hypothetical protein